jgi:hypothetical protein
MPSSNAYQPQDCYDLTATIANGQTTSGQVDLAGTTLCGFIMPAAFTGTVITLTMSDANGGTFVTAQDGSGSDLSLTVAVNKYIPINNLALTAGLRFVKVVSNASEGAQRVIKLVTRAV